jgi:hypothetical protein
VCCLLLSVVLVAVVLLVALVLLRLAALLAVVLLTAMVLAALTLLRVVVAALRRGHWLRNSPAEMACTVDGHRRFVHAGLFSMAG